MSAINIDKLHTTPMGAERIRRVIGSREDDVVSWAKDFVDKADTIVKRGKNWYAYGDGLVLTINAGSLTIITARKINAKVRVMRESDYKYLPEFLYHAIFIPEGGEAPERDIINDPSIFIYIKDFGSMPGDLGVVAEQNSHIIGAAWTRIIPAYGHIDQETPELAISVLPAFRGYGAGVKLMKKLFEELRKKGYSRTSLSVQKANPAVRFYQRLGYTVAGSFADRDERGDYLMIKTL